MTEHSTDHPTPALYVKIAVLLAVLTAIEVALYYVNRAIELGVFNFVLLLALALLKFLIVIGWYMHLRYEKKMLSRFFATGFVIAMFCYGIVLGTFGVLAITRS